MSYLDKILELDREGAFAPGKVSRVSVSHDDWCRVFKGGACNCNPDISTAKPNRAQRRAAKRNC